MLLLLLSILLLVKLVECLWLRLVAVNPSSGSSGSRVVAKTWLWLLVKVLVLVVVVWNIIEWLTKSSTWSSGGSGGWSSSTIRSWLTSWNTSNVGANWWHGSSISWTRNNGWNRWSTVLRLLSSLLLIIAAGVSQSSIVSQWRTSGTSVVQLLEIVE